MRTLIELQMMSRKQLWDARHEENLYFKQDFGSVMIYRYNQLDMPELVTVWTKRQYNKLAGITYLYAVVFIAAVFALITLGTIIGMSIMGGGLVEQLPAVAVFFITIGISILGAVAIERK